MSGIFKIPVSEVKRRKQNKEKLRQRRQEARKLRKEIAKKELESLLNSDLNLK